MTDHEHAEVSRKLALAIGYLPEHIRTAPDAAFVVEVNRPGIYGDSWRRFDYDCPLVIWPIAERFDCFPQKPMDTGTWWAICPPGKGNGVWSNYAALAVARAVIASQEAK